MVKKHVLVPAEDVDPSTLKYKPQVFQAPHVTGWALKLFTRIVEAPVIGSLLIKRLKKKNKMDELLRNTVIPEAPMFQPQFPPQDPEQGVVLLDEDGKPQERVELALSCLPDYDPSTYWDGDSVSSFRYWKIRDYAHAYRSMLVTPSQVAERFISIIEDFNKKMPSMPLLVSFDADDVRRQASASTQRFKDGIGNAISILDGILIAIKDDIDCYPHPTKGGTTWLHEVRSIEGDAVTVSRLRSCGVVLVGKANMHELGCGTTGNNANYGTPRNPHAVERYTGGSSSGPAAIVASGLCAAALGTDGGGSIRIPSSLCGVVGLKTTYGHVDTTGSLSDAGTVDILGPIASSVEDVMLVYAVILGSSPTDRINLRPSPPCLPNLQSTAASGSFRLGKYTEWFNDVHSTDISVKCDDVLRLLSKANGCKVVDIVIPEILETCTAHLVTIGSEILYSATPDCEDGKDVKLTYDIRTFLAFFRSFNSSDYFAAQCLRRRIMYYYMEIFKKVDVIVTPTTGMTAPIIPPSAVKYGETDMQLTAYLMRYVVAANLLGLPAISIPVCYDKQGLPIGLQLIGRPWGEATILRLASAVEELCSKSKKQPAEFYDVLRVK